jgi:hypothetical protein
MEIDPLAMMTTPPAVATSATDHQAGAEFAHAVGIADRD